MQDYPTTPRLYDEVICTKPEAMVYYGFRTLTVSSTEITLKRQEVRYAPTSTYG